MPKPTTRLPHHIWLLAGNMLSGAMALLPLAVVTLALGMAIYHYVEGRDWSDAFLNAAMLLGGMGRSTGWRRRLVSGWPVSTRSLPAWSSWYWLA